MRLSDLLKLETVNEQGERLGHVHDVRFSALTQDPNGWTAASLIVGPVGIAVRLGYGHGEVRRPRVVAWLLDRVLHQGMEIPWDRVVSVGDTLVVRGRRSDFTSPPPTEPEAGR